MPLQCFSFGTAYSAIMFAVATDTTISCNRYSSVISLSFLDAYGNHVFILDICGLALDI